jgi:hypothetical protein
MNKIFYFLLCITLFNNTINADSPLTSTDFYKAYLDVPEVLEASKSDGVLSSNFFNFLNAKENKIDAKIALINALKWNLKGKKNAQVYINKLFALNKNYTSNNFYLKASAEELICYSYIKAMDNYFDVYELLFKKTQLIDNTFYLYYPLRNKIFEPVYSTTTTYSISEFEENLITIDETKYVYSPEKVINNKTFISPFLYVFDNLLNFYQG